MAHKHPRYSWHVVNGKWSRSFGERGVRVRLFQKRRDGVFYRAVWIPGVGRDTKSLGTRDRAAAEALGRALLAELLGGRGGRGAEPARLGPVWDRYSAESPAFLDNAPRTQAEERARAAVLLAWFGRGRDVTTISGHDWACYAAARKRGGLRPAADRGLTMPVGARSVEADYRLASAMFRWACTVRVDTRGTRWLDRNPLDGIRVERERNPRRPVATRDRFEATRVAMTERCAAAAIDEERRGWWMAEFALLLAESTGRRVSAILALRWDDFDTDRGEIRWRADADKLGAEWTVPMPAAVWSAVGAFRRRLGGAPTDYVFASSRRLGRPVNRSWLDNRLREAEAAAGLPKLRGSLWHAYRRKWASERKQFPLKDVAAVGGWKAVQTLLTCYQHADADTMRRVMDEPTGRVEGDPKADRQEKRCEKRHLAIMK